MSICYDLSLIKKKYHLEEDQHRHNTLLEELLNEEDENCKIFDKIVIMEEAPKELYEDEGINLNQNEEKKEENILNENDQLDNIDTIENINNDETKQNDMMVEVKREEIQENNLEVKDSRNDWKNYLLNFGGGNASVFKDFSQGGAFKSNFHKKDKTKKINKNEENEQKPVIKNKENALFEFKVDNVPEKNEIFKKKCQEYIKNEPFIFLGKKRKILKLNHLESSL